MYIDTKQTLWNRFSKWTMNQKENSTKHTHEFWRINGRISQLCNFVELNWWYEPEKLSFVPIAFKFCCSCSNAACKRDSRTALTPFWSRPRAANSARNSTTFNFAGSIVAQLTMSTLNSALLTFAIIGKAEETEKRKRRRWWWEQNFKQ